MPPMVVPKTKLDPIKNGIGKLAVSEMIKFTFVFVDPFWIPNIRKKTIPIFEIKIKKLNLRRFFIYENLQEFNLQLTVYKSNFLKDSFFLPKNLMLLILLDLH